MLLDHQNTTVLWSTGKIYAVKKPSDVVTTQTSISLPDYCSKYFQLINEADTKKLNIIQGIFFTCSMYILSS